MASQRDLYCDGGVCLKNPSPYGGSWFWVAVESFGGDGEGGLDWDGDAGIVASCGGRILAADYRGRKTPPGLVGNNAAELWAACQGLLAMPEGWDGVLHSDSQVTLRRLDRKWARLDKLTGCSEQLVELLRLALERAGDFNTVLLQGHPTRKELASGVGKSGRPVSRFNHYCDLRCQAINEALAFDMGVVRHEESKNTSIRSGQTFSSCLADGPAGVGVGVRLPPDS